MGSPAAPITRGKSVLIPTRKDITVSAKYNRALLVGFTGGGPVHCGIRWQVGIKAGDTSVGVWPSAQWSSGASGVRWWQKGGARLGGILV